MDKVSGFVVKRRGLIVAFYLLLLLPSALGYLMTDHNYDILAYLPDDLNSREGELLIDEKFGLSGIGLLMVEGMPFWQIRSLSESIEAVEGVEKVLWLEDYSEIFLPVQFMNPRVRERFISGEAVLLQIQFVENARSESTVRAVDQIRDLIDEKAALGGEPPIINEFQKITEKEMLYYAAVAVLAIYFVLSLSVTSYIEPLLFLVSVGVAVAINMGTNAFMGEISFMTASIAAVMQLGISLDYSIFLLHRFEEEKASFPCPKEAMKSAVSRTTVAISSSALTTIGGFFALTVMQNGIGQDLGFVLGKGIIVSLIVNLTFLPGLILIFSRFSDRFRHRIALPSFKRVSNPIIKGRIPCLIIMALVAALAFLAQGKTEYYYSTEYYLPQSSEAVADTRKIMEQFGIAGTLYLVTADRGSLAEIRLMEKLKAIPDVEAVICLSGEAGPAIPDTFIPPEVKDSFKAGDYRYLNIYLPSFDRERDAFEVVDLIREYAGSEFDEYYLTGSMALTRDMASLVDKDARNVTLVSTVLIALIIALSFRSFSIPLLLIAVIKAAIWINLSIPYFQGLQLSSLTPMIIGAIQLGATVDYAILFTLRYRENIARIEGRVEAMKQTIEDTGRSILTSALTMFSATIGIAFMTSIRTTGEMTLLIGRGALISMALIFLALPALLLVFDRAVSHTTHNWGGREEEKPVKFFRIKIKRSI